MHFDDQAQALVGEHGTLSIAEHDEVALKFAMLLEGECEGLGPLKAAAKHGYTKQRHFQLREAYEEHGALGLLSKVCGPKTNYRRTSGLQRQVIRHRFLDPLTKLPWT